jgi:hypothetical protein
MNDADVNSGPTEVRKTPALKRPRSWRIFTACAVPIGDEE